MKIIYKKDNLIEFTKYWEDYIGNNLASYQYLTLHIESLIFFIKSLIVDMSFVVVENNKCVGICFLPIERFDGVVSISRSGVYVQSPLAINKRIEKNIYKEIDKISKAYNIDKISFSLDPLVLEYKEKFNSLLEYGFVDSSTTDCIVDLNQAEEKLWQNLRKSYKALINSVLKNDEFEIVIIDRTNPNYGLHELYRELHIKCAGGITRAKQTFDKQFEMLKNDYATLIGLKYNGKFIGFNYFFHFQKTVIYASGADAPEYENSKIPIYHVILWSAINYYKERKFEFIEFSQPCGYNEVNGFNDYLDKKQINISLFKQGMGTRMISAFRGIKYLNHNLFIEDVEKFKSKVISL